MQTALISFYLTLAAMMLGWIIYRHFVNQNAKSSGRLPDEFIPLEPNHTGFLAVPVCIMSFSLVYNLGGILTDAGIVLLTAIFLWFAGALEEKGRLQPTLSLFTGIMLIALLFHSIGLRGTGFGGFLGISSAGQFPAMIIYLLIYAVVAVIIKSILQIDGMAATVIFITSTGYGIFSLPAGNIPLTAAAFFLAGFSFFMIMARKYYPGNIPKSMLYPVSFSLMMIIHGLMEYSSIKQGYPLSPGISLPMLISFFFVPGITALIIAADRRAPKPRFTVMFGREENLFSNYARKSLAKSLINLNIAIILLSIALCHVDQHLLFFAAIIAVPMVYSRVNAADGRLRKLISRFNVNEGFIPGAVYNKNEISISDQAESL